MAHDAPQDAEHPHFGVEPRWSAAELALALGGNVPTEQQQEVIEAPLSPRLVVAGAGSGKTATMVDRVVWLVANGIVRADQVLGVTFTRKAAGELRDRVRGRLGVLRAKGLVVDPHGAHDRGARPGEPEDRADAADGSARTDGGEDPIATVLEPTVLTYHSYASTLVRTYGLRIGVEPETALLGQAQAWQMASRVVESWDGPVPPDFKLSTATQQVLALSSGAAEHLLEMDTIREYSERLGHRMLETPARPGSRKKRITKEQTATAERLLRTGVLCGMAQRYQQAKQDAEVMDFGDLLARAARIAAEDRTCAAAERERFRVVLLDEFQDTSHAQMEIFARLYGRGHSVMAVGDPQQSIYGFRGASAGQLFGFAEHFPAPGDPDDAVSFLTTAWRNDVAILDAANHIAGPLRTPPPWADGGSGRGLTEVPGLEPRPGAPRGTVQITGHRTDQEEAAAIADAVLTARSEAPADRPLPTTAVLCRRRAQFEAVRRELEARDIPVEVVGIGGLLQVPEVVDVVATLRVLTDPGRSDSLARLLTGARWRIGARDLVALGDWAGHLERRRTAAADMGLIEAVDEAGDPDTAAAGLRRDEDAGPAADPDEVLIEPDMVDAASLVEAVETLPRPGWVSGAGRSLTEVGRQRLVAFAEELAELRTWLSEDLPTVISVIERTLGLDIEIAARPGARAEQGRRDLDAFLDLAASFTSTSGAQDAGSFLAWLDVAAQEEKLDTAPPEPAPGAVQLLTVHASKGLEWDHVHVPGMNQGHFPSTRDSRWTKSASDVPWPLRGDRDFLPQWSEDTSDLEALPASLALFEEDAAQHAEAEERRLAYVAFTRARTHLHLSSTAFSGTAASRLVPSRFLLELLPLTGERGLEIAREAAQDKAFEASPVTLPQDGEATPVEGIDLAGWVEVGPEEANPETSRRLWALWPYDPLEGPEITETRGDGERRPSAPSADPSQDTAEQQREVRPPARAGRRRAVEAAAELVRRGGDLEPGAEADPAECDPRDDPQASRWIEEARILLAAHERRSDVQELALPSHLSASTVVALGRDPRAVAAQFRRPMPRRPGMAARAGTTFHSWVEDHFGSSAIFDLDELPAADDFVDEAYDLPRLAETFRASEWGRRQPWSVEHAIETPIAGVTVRGRIDAVFRGDDGTWELVDWKTGAVPSARELSERAVQLAVYRLGWSRLQGVPLEDVSAAFYYVAADRTIRPHDLADEEQLERMVARAFG
ncbi:ATP-dependent DNA helicase [Kocuria palustris]|uniref:ATP-dependent helicase n=1 Tax=Kocuria palustris TaxID=71999 RepID=UPI0011A7EBED|nr:ATP-dependent DNA helicase [Kocuria palustris]